MADLIFSDMPQFVILATRKGGADVAEGFLLADVTRWARSVYLAYFLRFPLPTPFLCHPMSSQIVLF